MPLETGRQLGPYEILAPLGAGGMGEVYRARDSRLNRDVALKLLPDAFAGDAERMARFEREAQLLASLNHPNIAAIHGLEESAGRPAIVMELVEGHEADGPLPVAEALRIARQIAEAIEFAHEKGIIHRDLKPANIRLTPDGAVKVLDFGLAKALDLSDDSSLETPLTNSPTLSLAATHVGVVLGTAAYMSPEQAKGKNVDRRADVWAFGVVLYELLTGKRLFGGETVAETLASVMKEPISLAALPADTPRAIRSLLVRCLDRDLRRRLQSIAEARIVIEDVINGVRDEDSPSPPSQGVAGGRQGWLALTAAVVALIGGAFWLGLRSGTVEPAAPAVMRFTVLPPEGTTLNVTNAAGPNQVISPDGRYLAFVSTAPGSGVGSDGTIWVRALDSLLAQRLDRTEGASYPFWSPDSQHLAYFADGKLMRIPVVGGAPRSVSDAPSGEGGAWFQDDGEEGIIVFAPGPTGPLHRVPARGGISTPLMALADGESGHVFPQFLPDGRVLYSARGDKSGVWVQTLASDQRTLVLDAETRGVYAHPGFLMYVQDNILLAHRFNLETLTLEGEPLAVAQDVRNTAANRRSAFSVSSDGVLVYRGGGAASVRLRWYGRDGKPGDLVHADAGSYSHLELSPDGRYLAVYVGPGEGDLWLKDLASGVFERLTSTPGPENQQVWSPDSRRLAFDTAKGIFHTVIGTGTVTPVPGGEGEYLLEQWTPDGAHLLVRPPGNGPLRLLPAPRDGGSKESTESTAAPQPRALFTPAYDVDHFRVSPNGKWVAYTSRESGRPEVMVASFPSFTNRRQVSLERGAQPQWRADGRELFFHGDLRMMAVDVVPGDTLQTGRPRELFRTNPAVMSLQIYLYAATADGQRFVLVEPAEGGNTVAEPIHVVSNWRSLIGN